MFKYLVKWLLSRSISPLDRSETDSITRDQIVYLSQSAGAEEYTDFSSADG